MNDESIRKTLETIVQRNIPENTNLWPRLAACLERKDTVSMNLKWKLVWTILLVLLGLSVVTGVAYAFYHYFNDAGLQSVSNAGLLSTVNATAQPTRMPTATPPEPVSVIGNSQTLEGVSLTLEWVYLMDGQQAFGFSTDGLEGRMSLGMPEMGFGKLIPQQYRGASMALKDETTSATGIYVVNQIVRDENTYGQTETRTDVSITIPLLDGNGQVLNTFRFEVDNELVHDGPFSGGNIYSTRANNLEMSLDWIILSSKTIQAQLCFTAPDGKDWTITAPSIQLASDVAQLGSATSTVSSQSSVPETDNGVRCQVVTFPVGAAGAQAFILTASELSTPAGDVLKGDWEFNWNQLPGRVQFPGIAPLEPDLHVSESVGSDMTVTLEKAYADIFRMVFVVSIKSPQAGQVVSSATLKDANGAELNSGLGISSLPDDPTSFTVELNPATEFTAGQFKGQLVVEIGTQFGSISPALAEAHFDVDLPVYPAVVFDPMQTVIANGVKILLQRIKVTPSYTKVYLCFQKPNQADWGIGYGSTLQVGEDIGTLYTANLLFDSEDTGNMPVLPEPGWITPVKIGRCVMAGFTVGHHGKPEELTLNIQQLEQSAPEDIPNDQIQAVRKKLLTKGIDMDWVTSSGNGGGGAGLVISKKPDGMTDDQVMQLFYEALGYYYLGPWKFTVEIKP